MNSIIQKAKEFEYSSIKYIEADELGDIKVTVDDTDCVMFYDVKEKHIKIHWGLNNRDKFIPNLKETIGIIRKSLTNTKINLNFILEEHIKDLKHMGFTVKSEWIDCWHNDVKGIKYPENLSIKEIKDEYKELSVITENCTDLSRGFYSTSSEDIESIHKDINSTVLVFKINDQVVGGSLLQIYGQDSAKGPVLWLKTLAVDPSYHGQGIGTSLTKAALLWGKKMGATRSFLAVDTENTALKIYENLGYIKNEGRGEINMELKI
ncbi:GNAT family N-acetyltransferase [Mycoplasmatota bacterium]|nr:GNAT family N-acetyltransferase [Mycoplasmatota bacterium]